MKIPSRFLPIMAMILAISLVRLMPYILGGLGLQDIQDKASFLWAFSPLGALFLFGGAQFADRRWAYLVPLAAMVFSDAGIGLLTGRLDYAIHPNTPVDYACYALTIWLGTRLRDRRTVGKIALSALAAELNFFVITNFAFWVTQTENFPHTFDGLAACYVAAVPFFRQNLIGMAVYTPLLFGGAAFLERKAAASLLTAGAFVPHSNRPSDA